MEGLLLIDFELRLLNISLASGRPMMSLAEDVLLRFPALVSTSVLALLLSNESVFSRILYASAEKYRLYTPYTIIVTPTRGRPTRLESTST